MGEHTGLIISLESHYHPERHGGGDREPESSKISSFLEGTTIKNHDFGEKNTITANRVIWKGGNQRNNILVPLSSYSPVSCHVSHWLNPTGRQRSREAG